MAGDYASQPLKACCASFTEGSLRMLCAASHPFLREGRHPTVAVQGRTSETLTRPGNRAFLWPVQHETALRPGNRGFLWPERVNRSDWCPGEHKAGGAALGLSCAACFERLAFISASRDALNNLLVGQEIPTSCPGSSDGLTPEGNSAEERSTDGMSG